MKRVSLIRKDESDHSTLVPCPALVGDLFFSCQIPRGDSVLKGFLSHQVGMT